MRDGIKRHVPPCLALLSFKGLALALFFFPLDIFLLKKIIMYHLVSVLHAVFQSWLNTGCLVSSLREIGDSSVTLPKDLPVFKSAGETSLELMSAVPKESCQEACCVFLLVAL